MSRGSVGPSTTKKSNSGIEEQRTGCQIVPEIELHSLARSFITNKTENQNKVLVQPLKVVEGEYEPYLLSNKPFVSLLPLIWLLPIPKRQVPKSAYME